MRSFILFKWFRNISIARKLYFTVGIMALLILTELITLWFAVNTLSAVRAYVGGEGLWSKAQKDAAYQLRKYQRTHDEADYVSFLNFMKVPLGDHKARLALMKPVPDLDAARQGFLEARNHPDDIDNLIKLVLRFHNISYINHAIAIWTAADPYAGQLLAVGQDLHAEINSPSPSTQKLDDIIQQVDPINAKVTELEDDFSYTLGEGSRWLEHLILKLLFSVALTVEISGLLLTFSVSRGITKGIREIVHASGLIAKGDSKARAKSFSKDEIGVLANSFNLMADSLQVQKERESRDVDEKKKSEEKFRGLLESAPDAIVIVDKQGIIQLINAQTEKLFGFKKEELLGKRVEMLIPQQFHEKHEGHRSNYFHAPSPREMGAGLNLSGRKKDGTEFPVEISLSPLETSEGLLVSAAIRDITDRRMREAEIEEKTEELERSNKELEHFAYIASHDLQEPLRTVTSYVQLLEKRYKDKLDKDGQEFIEYAVDASARMRNLINDLLSFSRVGSQEKHFTQVHIDDILKTVTINLKPRINETKAEIIVDNMPTIQADESQMRQLFQNLIGNAIKFKSEKKPRIKITAKMKGRHYLFSIEDNGIGIEKQYEEKIFQLFQRLHDRSKYPGTGIGLAICKKIVERHGGAIWIEPNEAKGTTFYFTIRV